MTRAATPTPDRGAARALRNALDRVGYDEEAIGEELGDDAFETGRSRIPIHDRRLPASPRATAIRLFFLTLAVPRATAEAALGTDAVGALGAIGLADVGADVIPRGRILPAEDLVIASDGYSLGVDDPPDYVATYTPTARVCVCLTPRPRVRRALDVGTGNGIHALLSARHAREVIATDVNQRALDFTALNAALNGFHNIQTRHGSLFEPVAGESFGLITCNAPYVVSPASDFVYRDAGLAGDEVSERVVAGAAAHLAEGGLATLLVSWVGRDADEPDARPLAWAEQTACDAWILSISGGDPLSHAAGWNDYLEDDASAYGRAVDEWVAYLDALGVEWVTEGAMLLHRRGDDAATVRLDELDDEELDRADGQIRRVFANRARLGRLPAAGSLLDERLALARTAVVETTAAPRRRGRPTHAVRLEEGTNWAYDLRPTDAELLASLDGSATLREAARAAAARPPHRLLRDLLEVGVLEFAR